MEKLLESEKDIENDFYANDSRDDDLKSEFFKRLLEMLLYQ